MSKNPAPPTFDALFKAVEKERVKGQTRSLDVSFHELGDMYKEGELVIEPEYQRGFRWSEQKQSQWIESILLGFPLPPLYALERKEGGWELIDGLQRFSSYLHFCGLLRDVRRSPAIERGDLLTLEDCDVVPTLNGCTFEDLGTALQYRLRRATIRVVLVRKDTDERGRYLVFKRLNSGGETLSDQEIRNATIRLLDNTFNALIQKLARNDHFLLVTEPLSDAQKNNLFREELVLRFFALKDAPTNFEGLMAPFLTSYLERVTAGMTSPRSGESTDPVEPFDVKAETELFERTFRVLAERLGRNAALRPVVASGSPEGVGSRHFGSFHVRTFEVLALAAAQWGKGVESMGWLEAWGQWATRFKSSDDVVEQLYAPTSDAQFYPGLLMGLVQECAHGFYP